MSDQIQVKITDSLVGALINAVINGYIMWNEFSKLDAVPLTLDMISTQEKSVFGQGVSLALALGVILTLVAWKVFSGAVAKKHPEALAIISKVTFKNALMIAVRNAMILFGWAVALAVVWQRFVGTIYVSPLVGAIMVACFAGIITVIVEMRTKMILLGQS